MGCYGKSNVARSKLPKWAIKQAGGINKKAWRLARRGQRKRSKTPSRKRATRNNPRSTMRRKKTFSIPLVQTVAGLALLGIASQGITQTGALAKPVATLQKAGDNLLTNKDQAIKIGLGSLVAQFVATEVLKKRTVGSIGPIKLKVA